MNVQRLRAVAFDCDGVMFDSTQANLAYYNHILAHVALPPMTREQFVYAHMHTADQTLAYLIADERILAAADRYRRTLSYLPFIRHMVKEPHLDRLLEALRPTYKIAIATNRTDTMQRVLLEHGLEDVFDCVVTARDVVHPKPHPEQLLYLLRVFKIAPLEMLFIGDSELDAAAAREAGVPFVAYANQALPADHHISDLSQVMRLLGL